MSNFKKINGSKKIYSLLLPSLCYILFCLWDITSGTLFSFSSIGILVILVILTLVLHSNVRWLKRSLSSYIILTDKEIIMHVYKFKNYRNLGKKSFIESLFYEQRNKYGLISNYWYFKQVIKFEDINAMKLNKDLTIYLNDGRKYIIYNDLFFKSDIDYIHEYASMLISK